MLILSSFTMDAQGELFKLLPKYQNNFDKIIVCDGQLSKQAKEYYLKINNIEVIDYPWDDNYKARYQMIAERAPKDSLILHLDSDELPSEDLLKELRKIEHDNDVHYHIPCVLYLTEDGKKYYTAEKESFKEFKGQWTKKVIYKNDDGLCFWSAGSHIVPYHENIFPKYIPYPYYHMKSLESFVYNDCYQAFLEPEGQQYSLTDARLFKMLIQCYKTTQEFKISLKKGTWSPPLKKFAWERRQNYTNPVSRLAWAYWILEGHSMPERDTFMEWENVKKYVIDLTIYNENKKKGNYIEIC